MLLGIFKLALQKLDFLLHQCLLFVEFGLCGKASTLAFLGLLLLHSESVSRFVELAGTLPAELVQALAQLPLRLLLLLGKLSQLLTPGLLSGHQLSSFGLHSPKLALEVVYLASDFFLILSELLLILRGGLFSDTSLKVELVGECSD